MAAQTEASMAPGLRVGSQGKFRCLARAYTHRVEGARGIGRDRRKRNFLLRHTGLRSAPPRTHPALRVIARHGPSAVGNPGGGGPKLGSAHRSPSSGRKTSRPHAQQRLVRWPPQRHGCHPCVASRAPHGHRSRRQAALASTSAAMAASRSGVSGVRRYGVTRGSSYRRVDRTSVRYLTVSRARLHASEAGRLSPSLPGFPVRPEWVAAEHRAAHPPSATRPRLALS